MKIVTQEAYTTFVEFAKQTNGNIVPWIFLKMIQDFAALEVKPAEYVSRKYIQTDCKQYATFRIL